MNLISVLRFHKSFINNSNDQYLNFAGYDRSIPGIPRYAVLGSDDTGNFSLEISDVRLEDDADYECQVGPVNYNRPIRAPAHLTVQGMQF